MEDWTRLQYQLCEAESEHSALVECFDHLKNKFKADFYAVALNDPSKKLDNKVWSSTYTTLTNSSNIIPTTWSMMSVLMPI